MPRPVPFAARLAALFLAFALAAPARADEVYGWDVSAEAKEVAQTSQRFLDAFRASDAPTMTKLAAGATPDPLLVLGGLLGSHARASLETPTAPGDYLQAARAYVALAKGNAAARGAAELLAARERYGREDLEREARLKAAYRTLARTDAPKDCEADLAKLAERDADLAAARASFTAVNLRVERGRCCRILRKDDVTVKAAREARAAAEAVPWPLGVARAARLEALECLRLGDMEGAAEATRTIARTHRDLGDRTLASKAERRLSSILRRAAHYEAALAAAHAAAEDGRAAGREGLVGHALLAEATVQGFRGLSADALRLATEAVATFRRAAEPVGEATAWSMLATEHLVHDRFADALLACDRAAEALGRTSDAVVAAFTWTNLGIVHRRLGRLDLALEDQRRALADAERSGQPGLVALARGNLGLVEADLGLPDFRTTLERALAEKRAAGDGTGAFETALALGTHLARRPETAADGRRRLADTVDEARRLGDPFHLAFALDAQATVAERDGDVRGALTLATEAEALYTSLDERSMRSARLQELIARLELANAAPERALAASQRAVALRRTLLAGLSEEDAAALGVIVRRASEVGLEAALARGPADPGSAAAAFDLLEGARAALLTAGIVQSDALLAAKVPEAALAAEAASRERVEAARARLVESLHGPGATVGALTKAARKDLDLAWDLHEQAVARIRREETRAAGVAFPAPVALAAFQATLPPAAAYVGYLVTPQRIVALVVTREKAVLRALGPSEGLATRVEGWLRLAATPGADDTGPAAALYDALVRPLEEDVQGRTALVVSPDGPLAFAPLEALLRTGEPRAERLLARWTVSYAPSATVLAALRSESTKAGAGAGFLGLGNPDYAPRPGEPSSAPPGLAPLPASAAEVRDVGALYPAAARTILLGAQASRAGLLAALAARPQRLRALHLATHAFLDPERPRRSCLVLAGGDVLDVDAIHRLRVPADLAVLSACATARGALVAGEGVSGLARGFFIAGVPRVVVSAWVVADESAAPVLVAFHRGVETEKQPYAAALRAAKLAALARGGAAAHPSAWAAFTLWGLPD